MNKETKQALRNRIQEIKEEEAKQEKEHSGLLQQRDRLLARIDTLEASIKDLVTERKKIREDIGGE